MFTIEERLFVNMPLCAGPVGPPGTVCPVTTRGKVVTLCQGDLFLCEQCNASRFGTKTKEASADGGNNKGNNGAPKKQSQIINHVLGYIRYAIDSSTDVNIKHAVTDHFKDQDIIDAKNILWEKCHEYLPEKQNRKDTSTRKAIEAHTSDMTDAIKKLIELDKSPKFLIDACTLQFIPKSRPEELNSVSLADRVNQLEGKLSSLINTVDRYIADNMVLQDKVCKLERLSSTLESTTTNVMAGNSLASSSIEPEKTYASALSAAPPPLPPPQPRQIGRGRATLHPNMRQSKPVGATNSTLMVPDIYGSQFSLDSMRSDHESGYHIPSYHLKKQHRDQQRTQQRNKRNVIKGKSMAKHGVKGAPEPSRHLFIFRVDNNTTEEDITNLLLSQQPSLTIRELVCTSHEDSKFKSFRLTVPISQYSELFNEELWPDGISIRPFRMPKPSDTNNGY